jgi:prepilin-type processing-associated H-X9-DG protein
MYTGQQDDTHRGTAIIANSNPQIYYTPQQDTPGYQNGYLFGGAHPGICNMAFCDGSIHSISFSIDQLIFQRLCNRADGQPIDASKF